MGMDNAANEALIRDVENEPNHDQAIIDAEEESK
jgi:hypothetical protein